MPLKPTPPAATKLPTAALLGAVLLSAALLHRPARAAETTEPVDVPITRGTIDLGSIRPSLGTAPRPTEATATTATTSPAPPAHTAPSALSPPSASAGTATTQPGTAPLPNPPRTVADFAAIARAKAAAEAAAAGTPGAAAATSEAHTAQAKPVAPPVAAHATTLHGSGPPAPRATAEPDTPTQAPSKAAPNTEPPPPAAVARPSASPNLRPPTPRSPQPKQDEGMAVLAEKILSAIARAEAKQTAPARPRKNKADAAASATPATPTTPAPTPATTQTAPPSKQPPAPTASRDALRAQASALAAEVSGNSEVFLDMPPWGYEGLGGPDNWHTLRPEYAMCALGQRQSPIAIDSTTTLQGPAETLALRYEPVQASVLHTGRSIQVDVAPGNWLTVRGTRFELIELRFQHPGEGPVNGTTYPMSVQLLHRSASGELAVLAIPLDVGKANTAINALWMHMPLDKDDRVPLGEPGLDVAALLPTDRRYFQYMGSLPTPPCTEDVLWLVMKTPVTLSPAQLTLFGQLFAQAARPPQPTNERPVREAL